jgi:hypothetical protein
MCRRPPVYAVGNILNRVCILSLFPLHTAFLTYLFLIYDLFT